ncbi:MAG: ABC transporter permease, partial [Anaerolineae bacterium]
MQRYFLTKFGESILLLLGVMVLVFFLVRITGDPANLMASREATPETIQQIRQEWGFDRPLLVQFWDFVTGAFVLDFGRSYHFRTEAMPMVLERLPATVELAAVGLLIAVVIGVPLGLVGGFNPGSVVDSVGRTLAMLAQSIPNFWLALILILFFAVRLGWLPSFGRDELKSVILPAFVLGLPVL